MATFFIPGDVITSVGIFGGGAPETGYYTATITGIEKHPTKVTSRKVSIEFAGFSTFDWLNSPFDADGNQLPGLSDNQVRGMVAAIKTVLVSAGFTNEQTTGSLARLCTLNGTRARTLVPSMVASRAT